ncbi:DUF2336 domain-containing protein [Chthonobacter albigriseus]|uniref:DUF2336 domain-containing protein n=1 Tax=Chthonobacter albigriseus TaxID=1683161 RepID=UPI0015EF0CB1|nr:DUF2336 domain-containing protein [Chthonobacter albigriseus]
MAPVPFSDGVQKLSQATDATRRRALLKAATELFVSVPVHPAPDIHIYEELALQLLRITPFDDRRAVATLLSQRSDAPAAVLSALMADDPTIASVVIRDARSVPEVELLALVATGSRAHLEALAQRPHPTPALVEALARNLPAEALPLLLANPTTALPPGATAILIRRAHGHPTLAVALGHRIGDIEDADLVDLFLDLDSKGRRRVLLALELLALRDFAARKPLAKAPTPHAVVVEDLARSALSRDLDIVAVHLSRLLEVDRAVAKRLLTDPGGEPLATALKASGLDEATAMRILLFSGLGEGRDYFEVKRLLEVFENTSQRSASFLLTRWRPDPEPLPRRRHRLTPQTEEGTPARPAERRTPAPPMRQAGRKSETG